MWQKVYNFCSDGFISLKILYKFSLIYKHKYAYLKPKKSEKETNFKEETYRKKISFPILQCRAGPMLSSVFWNANAYLSEIFYSTFLNLKHIQNITTVKQMHQIRLMIYTSQRQCSNVQACIIDYNQIFNLWYRCWSHLTKKNILKGVSFISGKMPHVALICFHYFCILIHNNIIIN